MGSKSLNYIVPEQSPRDKTSRDFSPKALEQWLDNLPRVNIGIMAKQVFDLIEESNSLVFTHQDRQKLLSQLYEPIDYLLEAMEKHYINHSFPLSIKNQKIALLVQKLLHIVVISYKSAILDTLKSHKIRINRVHLATLMHNHLAFNNRLLLCHSLTYSTISSAFWREQSLILQYAEQQALSEISIFGSGSPWNVLTRYKQAILLTLATPFSFGQQEIQQLNNHISEWVTNCRLLSMEKYTPGIHTYFINLNGSRGPQHLQKPKDDNPGWRIIDTSLITSTLNQKISQTHHDELNTTQLRKETLQRVCKQLSNGQKRLFNRTEKPDTFTLAIGTSAIHWMLNHHIGDDRDIERPACYQSTMVTNANGNDAPDVWNVYRDSGTTSKLTDSKYKKTIKYKTYDFSVVDESANGFKLKLKNNNDASGLKVGELVSLHKGFNGSGKQFGLALIRWLHNSSQNELTIGIELVAPNAQPIEIGLTKNKDIPNSLNLMRALLLPSLVSIKQPTTLIVPSTFKENQLAHIHAKNEIKLILLKKLIHQSGNHSQFEFEYQKGLVDEKPKIVSIQGKNDNLDNAWELL